MTKTESHIETKLIHAGEPRPRIGGAVSLPIFQSSTFEYDSGSGSEDIKYIRLNNTPNHLALNEKLAALENAEAAIVTASGMAAVSTALLTVLGSGDHMLAQNCLYGGTHTLITGDLGQYGIAYDFIDGGDPASWEAMLKPNTRIIYVETMTNPLMQVADLKGIVDFARSHGLISMIDNTFASPVNFRPAEWGFDLSIHSCTKYLNGHSDIVAGAVIGRRELIERILTRLNHLGATLDPHACFLLYRGLKTLAVRMNYQNRSAVQIAEFLEQHPCVEKVNFPGLPAHPDHERARELFDGYSGMLSFEPRGGLKAANRFLGKLRIPVVAPSLGGVETLVTRPAMTSHSSMSLEDRRLMGVSDSLIRISVGIEATEDLIDDFENALGR